jgi:hypothetical protein
MVLQSDLTCVTTSPSGKSAESSFGLVAWYLNLRQQPFFARLQASQQFQPPRLEGSDALLR